MAQPLSLPAIKTAISKYAPILRIHPDEKYLPCSVDWFLTHCTLIDNQNPSVTVTHPLSSQLPQGPKEGTRYDFVVDPLAKPGNLSTAKAYVNALYVPGTDYTDLQFWFFSAFNGPGTARFNSLVLNKVAHTGDIDLTPLGEHWADWEYAAIRISNASQEMSGIILSAHGKNILYPPSAFSTTFQFQNGNHPVIYSSLNGHANFPSVGPNYTEHRSVLGTPVGLEFNLLNTTSSSGPSLDCSQPERYEIVAAEYLKEELKSPEWVNYKYRWGPEGTAITMDSKTLGAFLKAGLGAKIAGPLTDTPLVLLASELLHIFVRADINGAEAPIIQAPWSGKY